MRERYLDIDVRRESIIDRILERDMDCDRCTSDNRPSSYRSMLDKFF